RPDARDLLEPRDVFARRLRQPIDLADAGGRRRPAGHRFVDRFACRQLADVGGELGERAVAAGVGRAARALFETVEDVALGYPRALGAVDAPGVADRDRIDPAAAPRPAGDGAVLAAALAQAVAHLARELGRKRSFANAGRVRLDDAEHLADRFRRNAEAGADTADRRVRRRDV